MHSIYMSQQGQKLYRDQSSKLRTKKILIRVYNLRKKMKTMKMFIIMIKN